MDKKTVLGALIGAGAAIAIIIALGAGGTILPFDVDSGDKELTAEQWGALTACYVEQGVWAHDASAIDAARLTSVGGKRARAWGTVATDSEAPPDGAQGISAAYGKALIDAATAGALPEEP